MSCKSCLYAANTATQAVDAGGVINFGSAVRRFGKNCNISGGNVIISGIGYYDLDANLTIVGTGTDTAIITLYKDGTAIPGATVSVTTASATSIPVSIPAVVRATCCYDSTITAVVTGAAVGVSNAAIEVSKI